MKLQSRLGAAFIGSAAAVLFSSAAFATPITASQIMANYNLVVAGNATTGADIEGSAVIGGNLNGATFFNNSSRLPADPTLYIYGANQSSNANINNHGSVHYGSNSGHFNLNSGSTAVQGAFSYALSDFLDPLNQLSTQLKGLTANSNVALGNSKATFNAAPDASGLAVFSLTGTELQNDLINNSLAFNQNGAKTIVVNVNGDFTEPNSANWNGPALTDVIFNFYNASNVTLGNWEGAILAPNAMLKNVSGALEEFVYANSFQSNGEVHNFDFDAPLPSASVKAPEPLTLSMFGAGILGAAAMRRRRKKA
jgi:choice-of-anchor A domain-containing protein